MQFKAYCQRKQMLHVRVACWCEQTASISLTVLHEDVQDFLSYVQGYYRLLQLTASATDDGDGDVNDAGLVIRTADEKHGSTSSSENGLSLSHSTLHVFKY